MVRVCRYEIPLYDSVLSLVLLVLREEYMTFGHLGLIYKMYT